jgi:hypothetical protein
MLTPGSTSNEDRGTTRMMGPLAVSATTTTESTYRPQGTFRARPEARPLLPIESSAPGATVSTPFGASRPALPRRKRASIVSARGSGSAYSPATLSSDNASTTGTPKPPAPSGDRALGRPISSSADHRLSGMTPPATAARASSVTISRNASAVAARSISPEDSASEAV